MVLYETAANAVDVAKVVAGRLPSTLSPAAKILYTALLATAVETGKGRGYAPSTAFVTFHLPLEVLADVCGMHRVTAWRNLKPLRELGVLAYRSHKGTLSRIGTVNTGTVFCVRLNPLAGSKARLSYDDMKFKWRDLDRDVRRKRTAHRQLKDRMQQSVETSTNELDISRLIHWTLPPHITNSRLATDRCTRARVDLEAVLDVRHAAKEDRNKMVELAAESLSQALNDAQSKSWYQKLLWQLLRYAKATGQDCSYSVYLMAVRARTDHSEGFARRPGALFTSRIKAAPWFEDIWRAEGRIGTEPN